MFTRRDNIVAIQVVFCQTASMVLGFIGYGERARLRARARRFEGFLTLIDCRFLIRLRYARIVSDVDRRRFSAC